MNFYGIMIGVFCFSAVIVCQPLIIKAEFYFTSRIWPAFLGLGIILFLISLFISFIWISAILCAAALTFFFGGMQLRQPLTGRGSKCPPSQSCRRNSRKF